MSSIGKKSILPIQLNVYFPDLSKEYQLKSLASRCQKTCYNLKLIQNLTKYYKFMKLSQ